MTREVGEGVLKDVNASVNDHLRAHIHLTNCIHLKNHMHKQSPEQAGRSLMRDLAVIRRSRSLRDPSMSPSAWQSPSVVGEVLRRRKGNSGIEIGRRSIREDRAMDIRDVPLGEHGNELPGIGDELVQEKLQGRDKTLSQQLQEILRVDNDAAASSHNHVQGRHVNFQTYRLAEEVDPAAEGQHSYLSRRRRRKFRASTSKDAGALNEISVASNSFAQGAGNQICHHTDGEEDYVNQNVSSGPINGCGIPLNWSRIHHRGKSFLDRAGRSLSCGLSDSKLRNRRGKDDSGVPISFYDSGSSSKSVAEGLPLLHDPYSGELGIYVDNLLSHEIESDLESETRSGEHRKHRGNGRGRHRSLTEKYVPRTFRDLVGQHLVVQALSNSVVKKKVGLVYVFYGPHGTGKTSTARIFARALDCRSPEPPKPCGVCKSCVAHDTGKSRNIREVGPLSNFDFESIMNHLDNMIVSKHPSHYRTFIFDDCDSLNPGSWSTIVKVIDRAPRHLVFVLVCSSLDVLPRIIMSRCQKFFFPKLKGADIIYALQWIATNEDLDIDKDALKLIASKSDGSLRDAEMTLEQLSLLGQKISVSLVQEMVGLVSEEKLVNLLDLALSADTVNTVKNLREITESGVEPLALMSQLATVITDILAGGYNFKNPGHRRKFFRRHALSREDMEKLRQALKTLSEAEKQLRNSSDRMTWLTAALLQLAPDQLFMKPSSSSDSTDHTPIELNKAGISQKPRMPRVNFSGNGGSEIVELEESPKGKKGEEAIEDHVQLNMQDRGKHLSSTIFPDRKHHGGSDRNMSLVKSKVSLADVIQKADGSDQPSVWSKGKGVSIAEKLEQENLRLEPRSRSLLCWKTPKTIRRKPSRLRVRMRKSKQLLKFMTCGRCTSSSRSPR